MNHNHDQARSCCIGIFDRSVAGARPHFWPAGSQVIGYILNQILVDPSPLIRRSEPTAKIASSSRNNVVRQHAQWPM
jgi:hypothetical protein